MKTTVTSVIIFLFAAFAVQAQQQIPTDRLYSVGEDFQPFFFQPSKISPYQTGVFGEVMGQLSDHPLSEINRNPANLNRLNERSYLYIDLNTLPDETLENYYSPCINCIAPFGINMPVEENRTVREPSFSAALFMQPFQDAGFRFGFTYQLMSLQEPYFELRSAADNTSYFPYRLTTNGVPTAEFPFQGPKDQFQTTGHFPALFAGYEFSERLSLGIKASYSSYSASGDQISEDFGSQAQTDFVPVYDNQYSRKRETGYDHWDFSAGVQAALNDQIMVGLSAGYLTGNLDQNGQQISRYDYRNRYLNNEDYYYNTFNDQFGRNGFQRTGQTLYAGSIIEIKRGQSDHLTFNYRISRSAQDFEFGSSLNSFQDSENYYQNNQGEVIYTLYETESSDITEGNGSATGWLHKAGISYARELVYGFQLRSGIQVHYGIEKEGFTQLQQRFSTSYSYVEADGEATRDYIYQNDFRVLNEINPANYRLTGYLPFILGRTFGDSFYAELGVMGSYQSEIRKRGQTTHYDNRYVTFRNGEEESGENQNRSDYERRNQEGHTFFNAFSSVTFSPGNQLKLRLMAFSDRRQINRISTVDAYRFQLSAEIGF